MLGCVPNTGILEVDQYPLHGLGLYEDLEPWGQYSGYVWSTWTTRKAQPIHIDPALQAMIDQSLQTDPKTAGQTYQGNAPSSSETTTGLKGSQLLVSNDAPPFPTSEEDVTMEVPADKRSRESPDSTLKPEGKSLKTSGVAPATSAEPIVSCASAAVSTVAEVTQCLQLLFGRLRRFQRLDRQCGDCSIACLLGS